MVYTNTNSTPDLNAATTSASSYQRPVQAEQPLARILVSDDSPDIQRIYTLLLPQHGFEVLVASDGKGHPTVELCQTTLPDLVITDVNKPDISGYDVCYAIRSDPRTAHIPLLFVTAMDETLDRKRGRRVGADDYIVKPFLFEGLLYRLVTLLSIVHGAKERMVSLKMGSPDFAHNHPLTTLAGPQALSRMLLRLTHDGTSGVLTFHIDGFDRLLHTYDRQFADALLLRLAIQVQKVVKQRTHHDVFIAHPSYGWHLTLVGPTQALSGLYREMETYFAAELQRRLRPDDQQRGYLTYTDLQGDAQQGPLPVLRAQWIGPEYGPLSNLRALWDALDQAAFL